MPRHAPTAKRDPDLAEALRSILRGIKRLRQAAHNSGLARKLNFTIDGRLVGDLGEFLASRYYDVELYPKLRKRHDGEASDGRKVEVKATFRGKLALRLEPDYLLGFQLAWDGTFTEVYNGPGDKIREYCDSNGQKQRSVTIEELRGLNEKVTATERIARRRRPKWSSLCPRI